MENNSFDQGYLTLAARLTKEDLDRSHPEYSTATPMLVWHCKALKNRKYVFGTPVAKIIHEVTYNGEKDEWYVDRYIKEENSVVFPEDPDLLGKADLVGENPIQIIGQHPSSAVAKGR